nr:zinc finger protein 4-like [Arachis hypogaea]
MAAQSSDACPSESSSISATFQGIDNNTRDNDLASEPDQASNSNNNMERMLDFVKLSNNDVSSIRCSSNVKELDFFNTGKRREFSSSQALGGHQNAHKQERAIAKRRQGMDTGAFGHPHFPYYPYHSFFTPSLYGSYNRTLGVRVESMIHKPSYPWSAGLRFGRNHNWSTQRILGSSSSLALDRLSIEGLQPNNEVGGVSGIQASSSNLRKEDDNGGNGNTSQLGDSSTNNVATSLTCHAKDDQDPKPDNEPSSSESPGLDLSLKL